MFDELVHSFMQLGECIVILHCFHVCGVCQLLGGYKNRVKLTVVQLDFQFGEWSEVLGSQIR